MSFSNIDVQEFKRLKGEDDHVILDVRTPGELAEGEVEGHVMINFNSPDFRDKVDELDRDKSYLVYCRSGNRSGQACMMMGDMGFEHLYNLKGGINAWNEAHAK